MEILIKSLAVVFWFEVVLVYLETQAQDIRVVEGVTKRWYAIGHDNPIPSALRIDDALIPKDSLALVSALVCAIKATQTMALMHSYESGICMISGKGLQNATTDGVVKYWIPFPPLDSLENVAPGGTTYSSPEYPILSKESPIDNDEMSYYGPTDVEGSWWMLDLGEMRDIYQIHILPRREDMPERVFDLEVRVGNTLRNDGDFSSYSLVHFYPGPYSVDQGRLIYSLLYGITGRYVSLQIVDFTVKSHIQICDVKVFALKK